MKVCFISHSAYMGGAERALLETIDALQKKGVQCYVLLPYDGPLSNHLRIRNVIFSIVPYRPWTGEENTSWWNRLKDAAITLAMVVPAVLKIRKWHCEIVYSNTVTIWIGAVAAAIVRKPHAWHIHEFVQEDHGLIYLYGEKASLIILNCLSSLCIANSSAVEQKFRQYIEPSKLKVVYQSVTLNSSELFIPPSKHFRCIIIGKVTAGKRQEDAILAVSDLVKKGLDIELYIVGDGNQEYISHLHKIIEENGLKKNITFTGRVENPFSYILSSDVVLMCSSAEAFGRVTVEGMLAGKPIVGTRSGGTLELIKDSLNGFLYTPGDYLDLSKKILYLYKHRDTAQQMGEYGKKWASQVFTHDSYGKELFTLLSSLIETKQ